ncbi:M14 family metallopeptidase [Tumidithrix elongata RA019]|uniref:M14 family metallopeptidase n=1 Tax=Tumidithrix elongata BACA0141 TaxID=2716417 RepID=A0AAW9QB44_9CYAN|nr:M14 family metallopeptidase [Tumidithrix elongata RA019]
MLNVLEHLPQGLLELEVTDLYKLLETPTLIHLEGERQAPLFVSILLHGNETTSWLAMRSLLQRYQGKVLPRSLSIFFGNVSAARYRQRHLDDQPDYNRIWQPGDSPEQKMAQQVIESMRSRGVFASIDVHNNTGLNPHYGCITRLDRRSLNLAKLFSRTVVYYTTPKTVQSCAFAELCPSIVIECGQPDVPDGTAHALEYLETCLALESISDREVTDIDLFHTVAIAKIPPSVSFGFADLNPQHSTVDLKPQTSNRDIYFPADLDRLNFCELPVGTKLGDIRATGDRAYLEAWDESGQDVSDRFFSYDQGAIRTRLPVMPSMLTLQPHIIRQDCLCYLMERLKI